MKKAIGFDTGPLISLVTNNLLWILEPLKERYKGEFFITPSVKSELIDKAFKTKRFELEAMQVYQYIRKGVLTVETDHGVEETRKKLMGLANTSFKADGQWLKIVSDAEIEVLAADAVMNTEVTVVDERTVRLLLENPDNLRELLQRKLHRKVDMDRENTDKIRNILKDVQIIRSTELVTIAYKMGILDKYLVDKSDFIKEPKKRLLDAALWAVKVRGCSISSQEIEEIVDKEA